MNSFFLFSIIFWIAAWIINIFIGQSALIKTKMVLPPILFGVSLLLIWEASIIAFDVSPVILPAPSLVFIKLINKLTLCDGKSGISINVTFPKNVSRTLCQIVLVEHPV